MNSECAISGQAAANLAVGRSGAYGPISSPGLFLSHGYPAEMLLAHGVPHLVRRRDTVEDMLGKQHLVKYVS